jgi:N-methylhydantoinase B
MVTEAPAIHGSGKRLRERRSRGVAMCASVEVGEGGYGNPLDREVERVLNDVAERYVSIEIARNVYGVVIEGKVANDSLAANIVATEKLRAEMRT